MWFRAFPGTASGKRTLFGTDSSDLIVNEFSQLQFVLGSHARYDLPVLVATLVPRLAISFCCGCLLQKCIRMSPARKAFALTTITLACMSHCPGAAPVCDPAEYEQCVGTMFSLSIFVASCPVLLCSVIARNGLEKQSVSADWFFLTSV